MFSNQKELQEHKEQVNLEIELLASQIESKESYLRLLEKKSHLIIGRDNEPKEEDKKIKKCMCNAEAWQEAFVNHLYCRIKSLENTVRENNLKDRFSKIEERLKYIEDGLSGMYKDFNRRS